MPNFNDFMCELNGLPPDQRRVLEHILEGIYTLALDVEVLPEIREKRLSEIDNYLTKKAQRSKSEVVIDESEYLRFVRNSIQHGSNVSAENVDKAMPIFWRLLAKSAPEWHREHLDHLLSYTMGMPPSLMIQSDDSSGASIIRHHQKVFKGLSPEDKRRIFRDLFLSIYIRPEFQQVLGKSKRSGSRERGNEY